MGDRDIRQYLQIYIHTHTHERADLTGRCVCDATVITRLFSLFIYFFATTLVLFFSSRQQTCPTFNCAGSCTVTLVCAYSQVAIQPRAQDSSLDAIYRSLLYMILHFELASGS